ncbi:DUF6268 family outer membrane beta-barrel protein [Hymenobacter sp. IS2118]|uniref:DUF6268 family outer membrane beta-barrel protein n=1 Tax=Hymenobacter sp. IS2118 TaxID=1505605 RepID=UPI001268AEB8|nr:DUF6268 family outer membrane beta-barrel protein [Hymenobacter sp. IS2118]
MNRFIALRFGLFLVVAMGAGHVARAQDPSRPPLYPPAAPPVTDSTLAPISQRVFANPSVLGMGPSKGLIVRYERTPRFGVQSEAQVVGIRSYNGQVDKNAHLSIKGYIPAWNRPHLKVVVGLSYEREEFKFKGPATTDYELYRNIENKGLKSIASQVVVLRPINEVHWFLARVKGELSGDYNSSTDLTTSDYSRFSAEAVYGWKRSPNFSWGLGFQYGYTFGRLSLYPAVLYNRTFNDRWGIEALFPARVTARYNVSESSIFYAGYTVDGYNYIVKLRNELARIDPNGAPLADKKPLRTLELRETEVKFRVRWERELLSFLWLGAEAGYRYNYAFDAFDRTNNDREKIIDSKFNGAPYAGLELFITPPRKLLEKAGVRR